MGCQLNENDSEKLCGMMEQMGYTKTERLEEADLIVFNTCCVRENAEDRLFGKLGEVKKYKEEKGTILAIGGCMMQEPHILEKIKKSYCPRFPNLSTSLFVRERISEAKSRVFLSASLKINLRRLCERPISPYSFCNRGRISTGL